MRTPDAEERFQHRRVRATNRVLDIALGADRRRVAELGYNALMVLARDMPSILEHVLDQAEALTPPRVPAQRTSA